MSYSMGFHNIPTIRALVKITVLDRGITLEKRNETVGWRNLFVL